MFIIYLCIFFLGASIASYINATVYRIEKGVKYPEILTKGSECEKCKKKLAWYELIPIFGYIFIGGKCPNCKEKVNIFYPLSETFLGISFLLFARSYFFLSVVPFYSWIILILLFILSFYDFLYREVPATLVHILIIISVLIFIFFNLNTISLIITGSILLLLFVLTRIIKKSFGFGDVLLLLALGLILPYQGYLVMFWISIFSALLYAIVAGIVMKKSMRKVKIPMIPFFTLGFLVATVWGGRIFEYLLALLVH